MDTLSHRGSFVPKLAGRCALLSAEAIQRLSAEPPVPSPRFRVPEIFWDIVEILEGILSDLDQFDDPTVERCPLKNRVLKNVELMMHRCVSLSDYLGEVLKRLLAEHGKKGRTSAAAKDRFPPVPM